MPHVTVSAAVITGNAGETMCYGTPPTRLQCFVKISSALPWTHGCGASDSTGCQPGNFNDPRPVLSHEFGHVMGLGHCDLNAGVMCNWIGAAGSCDPMIKSCAQTDLRWQAIGTMYWTPQQRDRWGLKAVYP